MAMILLIVFIFMVVSGFVLSHLEVKRERRRRRERLKYRIGGIKRD